jgi:hypothetical protein
MDDGPAKLERVVPGLLQTGRPMDSAVLETTDAAWPAAALGVFRGE